MNKKVPIKVYMEVAVGFFISLLILSYFSYRLLFPLLLQYLNLEFTAYITFLVSFIICSLMVRPTIKKEMKKAGEPFSIVARNPDIEFKKEKITLKTLFLRGVFSIVLAGLLSLPFSLIILFRYVVNPLKDIGVFLTLFNEYAWFYYFFLCASFFVIFIFVPSLKKWHYTKYQF